LQTFVVATAVALVICVIAWKHGIRGDSRSLIQGLIVVLAALITSDAYLQLKTSMGREPDFFDKFWISLPLLASFVVSGRCIFGRLAQLIVKTRRRKRQREV
jgi:hypothetical protein